VNEFSPTVLGMTNVKDFGAVGDGATDDTTAIQAAVTYAVAHRNDTVFFPVGTYKVTGQITVAQGVKLKGPGSQGSTSTYGVVISHQANATDCFVWDSSGAAAASTGGGIENMFILKPTGFNGGNAIKLLAVDDNHRPGEMTFYNVLIAGEGTGTWTRCLWVDGTACNTPGSKGVRTIFCSKLRMASASTDYEYALFNQCLHLWGDGFEIDTGNGTGAAGMTIKSASDAVQMSGVEINGDVLIDVAAGSNVGNVMIHGRCNNLKQYGLATAGTWTGRITGTIENHSDAFKLLSPDAPAFQAHRDANTAGVTGDGTPYTVTYSGESFDINSNFDYTTGIFTAPANGLYFFEGQVYMNGLTAGTTLATLDLVKTAGAEPGAVSQTIRAYGNKVVNVMNGGNMQMRMHGFLPLKYGDTVKLVLTVSNGAAGAVNVGGAGGQQYTTFSGRLT